MADTLQNPSIRKKVFVSHVSGTDAANLQANINTALVTIFTDATYFYDIMDIKYLSDTSAWIIYYLIYVPTLV